MKETAKTFLYFYQRVFFYITQAKTELLKPLGFWNETILILTFLAVQGSHPSLIETIGVYVLVLFIATITGKIIVASGVMKYNQTISNHQNPELMEILKEIREIKEKIK